MAAPTPTSGGGSKKDMITITVTSGTVSRKVQVPKGTTVKDVRSKLGPKMNIEPGFQAYLAGPSAAPTATTDTAEVQEDFTVSFAKVQGNKG